MSTLPPNFQYNASTLVSKTVLVTAAASEIGSSVCYAAAQSGATVLMMDTKQRHMNALYDKIVSNGWPQPMMIEFDLKKSDESTISQLASLLKNEIKQLDGLVHCAMWGAPLTPIEHTSIETWLSVLSNQLIKPMALTQSLIPLMKQSPGASIVFTALDTGRIGRAYWGGIATAFAGIENLSEILASELQSRSIRVNTLDPGKVKTGLRKQFYPGESADNLRDANDREIMEHYMYLLSDQSTKESGLRFTVPEKNRH